MNVPDAQLSDDIDLLYADWGEPITWQDGAGNPTITAILDEGPPNLVPDSRGPDPLIDKLISVRLSELPSGYDLQTVRILHNGATYAVMNHQAEGLTMTLECRRIT